MSQILQGIEAISIRFSSDRDFFKNKVTQKKEIHRENYPDVNLDKTCRH